MRWSEKQIKKLNGRLHRKSMSIAKVMMVNTINIVNTVNTVNTVITVIAVVAGITVDMFTRVIDFIDIIIGNAYCLLL